MTLTVDVTPLLAVVGRLDARVAAAVPAAVRATAQFLFDFALMRVNKHTKTGAMARSLRLRKDGSGWVIGHDLQAARHALFVHWGTRPHLIRPRNKRVLRWPGAGGFRFAKVVRHPGYKGDPYMVQAARLAPFDFQRRLRDQLRKG